MAAWQHWTAAGAVAAGELRLGTVATQPVLGNRRGCQQRAQPSPGSTSAAHRVPSPEEALWGWLERWAARDWELLEEQHTGAALPQALLTLPGGRSSLLLLV